MSVARGWWIGWSSAAPRRSGVFTVEILERASNPTTTKLDLNFDFKEKMDVLKEKMGVGSSSFPRGEKEKDKEKEKEKESLRHGDIFRLRSAKFPEFELGITSVKVADDFCYLGLRKVIYLCIIYIIYLYIYIYSLLQFEF